MKRRNPEDTGQARGAGSRRTLLQRDCAILTLNAAREGLEPAFGAAYMMMDRAFVSLDGRREGILRVRLSAKDGAAPRALAEAFWEELDAQKLRWAILRNNQPIREYVVENAILLAQGAPAVASAAAAAEELTDAQRQDIDRLIAEVEAEIQAMNEKKAAEDPKRLRSSWEDRQEKSA